MHGFKVHAINPLQDIAQATYGLIISNCRTAVKADQVTVFEKLRDFQLLNTVVAQPAEVGDQFL